MTDQRSADNSKSSCLGGGVEPPLLLSSSRKRSCLRLRMGFAPGLLERAGWLRVSELADWCLDRLGESGMRAELWGSSWGIDFDMERRQPVGSCWGSCSAWPRRGRKRSTRHLLSPIKTIRNSIPSALLSGQRTRRCHKRCLDTDRR